MSRMRLREIIGKPLTGEWGNEDLTGTGVPVLRTTNFTNDGIISFDNVVTRDISPNRLNDKWLKHGDIIIEKSGGSDRQPVGRVVYYVGENNAYTFNNFTSALRVQDQSHWNPKFVFYALFYNYAIGGTRKYENKTTGLHNLKLNLFVDKFAINWISVSEQNRIVAVIDAITHLISLRQRQAEKLDELVKARFVEMFGDPVLNTRRLPSAFGTSLFKLSNGKAVPAEKRFDSGIPAYGGNGISWYTDEALINTDTLVVGRVGFQSGNVHFAYGPLWITDNAMYVTWYRKELICLRFLNQLMKRVDFSRYQDAGDLKKITQKPFMKFEYILPSMNLQMEFVNFMDSVNCEKERIQRSAALLETLKRSLMQQYFG